ncbi:MAG: LysM peptidoglycan-binding domain-containing protein [Deltaproteobacteria bacterium]|jgi:LysM repeat protein
MKNRLDPDIDHMGKEFAEDLKHFREDTRIRCTRTPTGFQKYRRTVLIIGMGVIFIIVSMGYISGGTNDVGETNISTITSKLKNVEQRLATIAGVEEKLASLENRVRRLEQTTARTKGPAAKEAKLDTKGNPHHEVQRGETLSAIAQKYGITIDELCRLNGITPQTVIRTGQMLSVTPGV